MVSTSNYSVLQSESDFSSLIQSSVSSPLRVYLIVFTASWHEPSLDLLPVLQSLASQHAHALHCASIDAEKVESVTQKYAQYVTSVPTALFIRGGAVVDSVEGADAQLIAAKTVQQINKATVSVSTTAKPAPAATLTQSSAAPAASASSSADELQSRLNKLVNTHPVMLFIKGTPSAPRCGFTRKLLTLMDDMHVEYGSFDILEDEAVRAGLKQKANWPTYPQVWIKGEFEGGLDVVTDLAAQGELINIIPRECVQAK